MALFGLQIKLYNLIGQGRFNNMAPFRYNLGKLQHIHIFHPPPLRRMKHTNRLAKEKSPYLLQHQHNPVDWYPWGKEAFTLAKTKNLPIFLSIGYSTCHWCHVMERESFENQEIAKQMNDNFVNIKVDREERPEIDAQYMLYVQATAGHGGWPLSVFLTPELKPFFGGTYFPPTDSFSAPGFKSILQIISKHWRNDCQEIKNNSENVIKLLLEIGSNARKEYNCDQWIEETFRYLDNKYDSEFGGFGASPKFPSPVNLDFLNSFSAFCHLQGVDSKANRALEMVIGTLKSIWKGGIHDHLGLGIHRYSVDRRWHLPHFEKMLYDQAQLIRAFANAYRIDKTGPKFCLDAINDITSYLRNHLLSPEGGFYCAEDADSLPSDGMDRKREGAFAVWTKDEIDKVLLSTRECEIFCSHFGIRQEGNVEGRHDIHGELKNQNVIAEQRDISETAKIFEISLGECERILGSCKAALAEKRTTRPKPSLDDKILISWNALAISGLCEAFKATDDPETLTLAENAAQFIINHLYSKDDGTLFRIYKDGPSDLKGLSKDYVHLVAALLDLFEVTFKMEYLTMAKTLNEKSLELFWDHLHGGYFVSEPSAEDVILPLKESQDSAEPSVNSVAAGNFLRLHLIYGDDKYQKLYEELLSSVAGEISEGAFSRPALMRWCVFEKSKPYLFTFNLPGNNYSVINLKDMIKVVEDSPISLFKVFSVQTNAEEFSIQICRNQTCLEPIKSIEKLQSSLKDMKI